MGRIWQKIIAGVRHHLAMMGESCESLDHVCLQFNCQEPDFQMVHECAQSLHMHLRCYLQASFFIFIFLGLFACVMLMMMWFLFREKVIWMECCTGEEVGGAGRRRPENMEAEKNSPNVKRVRGGSCSFKSPYLTGRQDSPKALVCPKSHSRAAV